MIVDVHSHFWEYPKHFNDDFLMQAKRSRGDVEVDLTVRWEDYRATALNCHKTIVFGGKAKLSGVWVPDRDVAEYVAKHPNELIGFLSVDPTQPGWQEELVEGHQDLKMRGIKLLSMYAGFSPNDSETRLPLGIRHPPWLARFTSHGHDVRRPGAPRLYIAASAGRSRHPFS